MERSCGDLTRDVDVLQRFTGVCDDEGEAIDMDLDTLVSMVVKEKIRASLGAIQPPKPRTLSVSAHADCLIQK